MKAAQTKSTKSPRSGKRHMQLNNLPWLLRQAKGVRKYLAVFFLINLIAMCISLFSSVVSKYVVDAAIGYHTEFFTRNVLIMLGSSVFAILFTAVSSVFSSYVSEKYAFSMRARMFDQVQRSAWKDVTTFHSGDLLSRLTSDVSSVSSGIISIASSSIVTALQLLIVLVVLLTYDPVMALFGLVVGPAGVVAAALYRKKFMSYQKQLRESESEYYSFFQEHLANLTVVKSFQLEARNNTYFESIRRRRLKLVLKSSRLSAAMNTVMGLIYSVGYVAAFSYCAYRLYSSSLLPEPTYTYGTMTLFLTLTSQLQGSIRALGGYIPQLYTMLVSAGRIRSVTELNAENYEDPGATNDAVGVDIEHVDFTYDTDKILRDVVLHVKPGERIGVVGSSGAGKTTLIRLLLSLVNPDCGSICYLQNGTALPASPAARRLIAYVPQGNTLLSGTVRENLLLADEGADDAALWQALELADAADFLRKIPEGLELVLSEKAGGLSEGQAQRIAIARALLRNRPVLILDEATSALDESTEARVLERITAKAGKTCFIITHRRSMLRYCDRVLEISDDGTATVNPAAT